MTTESAPIYEWQVTSSTDPNKVYLVTYDPETGRWDCDCPASKTCKHILTKQQEVVAGKVKVDVPASDLDPAFGVFTGPGAPTAASLVERSKAAIEKLTADAVTPDEVRGLLQSGWPDRPEDIALKEAIQRGDLLPTPPTPGQLADRQLQEAALQAAQEAALATEPTLAVDDIETAIVAVMAEIAYVQKSGRVESGPAKYNFAGEADLIRALRPHLVKNGITMAVTKIKHITVREYETRGGAAMTNTQLLQRVTFTHAPSKTKKHVWTAGEGSDSGDKSTPKALTGGYKYALRQTFIIETGDDPDQQASNEQSRASSGERRARGEAVRENANNRSDAAVPTWWNWFISQRKDKGLQAADLVPVLGGPCAPLRVTTYLDALEPKPLTAEEISAALQKLLSRAVDWKSKRQEG